MTHTPNLLWISQSTNHAHKFRSFWKLQLSQWRIECPLTLHISCGESKPYNGSFTSTFCIWIFPFCKLSQIAWIAITFTELANVKWFYVAQNNINICIVTGIKTLHTHTQTHIKIQIKQNIWIVYVQMWLI